ncbi:MAG: AP2 domain-containing protein [Sedimentisphaerales bacterium]
MLWYRRLRYGYPFRRIPLSQGKYAIVDPEDYERLSRHKWYACKRNRTCYANRGQWSPILKKRLTISMHREIIDVPVGLFLDHINHNGWDNRKANLRPATAAENARNARYPKINTTSKYRGVWYNKKKKRWRAVISINNKKKHLGYFIKEIDAAKAYDQAAKHFYREFAILNFPNDS